MKDFDFLLVLAAVVGIVVLFYGNLEAIAQGGTQIAPYGVQCGDDYVDVIMKTRKEVDLSQMKR